MKLHAVAIFTLFAAAFANPIELEQRADLEPRGKVKTQTQTITGPGGHITATVTRTVTHIGPPQKTTVVETVTKKTTETGKKKSTTTKKASPTGGKGSCPSRPVSVCSVSTASCPCEFLNANGVIVRGTCNRQLLGLFVCNPIN